MSACSSNNYVLAQNGPLTVLSVPASVSNAQVIATLNRLILYPLDGHEPTQINWSAIKALPAGKLLRTRRSSLGSVVTADLPHWTGEYVIGQ